MKKLIFLLAFYILISNKLYAFDLGFAREDGGRPGAFLSYGAGARSLGMGKTFVGIADDASATYWNPAGLSQLRQDELTALHASLYERTGYNFVSYGHPVNTATGKNLGTVGIAFVNLNSKGFQLRNELNYEQGEGGVSESAVILSYGTKLAECLQLKAKSLKNLSLGVNLKLINQNVDTKSDTGYGIDAGLFWKAKPSLSMGLNIQNLIAPKITLIENTDKYPLSATLGVGYKLLSDKLLLALDINKTENRQLKFHLGSEYTIARMFSIRAGIDETEFACGLGMKWSNYSIDYAFAYHDAWKGQGDLGASHRFGLTVKWGSLKTEGDDKLIRVSRYVDKERQREEMVAKAEAEVNVTNGGTTQQIDEEKLKEKIKEAVEKETGEEVSEVTIEKIEDTRYKGVGEQQEVQQAVDVQQVSPARCKAVRYVVKQGDCLWTIAGKPEIYNNPWNWILIYEANKEQIKNPDLIYPGQEFKIPPKNR